MNAKPSAQSRKVRPMARLEGSIRRRVGVAVLGMVAIAVMVTGCQPSRYAGIPLKPGAAAPDLQQVAHMAQSGDKKAQFALGKMLIAGKGVPQNVKAGLRLIRMAAADIPASYVVSAPAATKGGAPYTVTMFMPVHGPGLPEAKAFLAYVKQLRRADEAKPLPSAQPAHELSSGDTDDANS